MRKSVYVRYIDVTTIYMSGQTRYRRIMGNSYLYMGGNHNQTSFSLFFGSPEKLHFHIFKLYLLREFLSYNKNEGSFGMPEASSRTTVARIFIFDLVLLL